MGLSGYKGISRVDSVKRKTHGWSVRVTREGVTYARFISDSTHGGEQRSLKKAIRVRNELESDVGKPRTDRVIMPPRHKKKEGNNTEYAGVNRVDVGPQGAFEITWSPEPGRMMRTKISIAKYGEKEALLRAIRLRQRKERQIFGAVLD